MAGKRPDQHNIAPSEAGTTDYKRYPEATHGLDEDLSTQGDKQRLAESKKGSQGQLNTEGQPFPPDVPAPSVDAQRGRKLPEDQPDAADTATGTENPLA